MMKTGMGWVVYDWLNGQYADSTQDVELNRLFPAEPKLPMFIKDITGAAKKRLDKAGIKVIDLQVRAYSLTS